MVAPAVLKLLLPESPGPSYGFTGTGARDCSGVVLLRQPRRTRSSRYRQISSGTCILPGGWLFPPGAGAVRHTRRCGFRCHRILVYRWMSAVRCLAFVHQSYGCCTIITHKRINHLKDRMGAHALNTIHFCQSPVPSAKCVCHRDIHRNRRPSITTGLGNHLIHS